MSLEAMKQALRALETVFMPHHPAVINLRLAIEQAEGRAEEQAEKQGPVAWWREDGSICVDESQASAHDIPLYTDRRLIPRDYTAPPQRQPLTDEQVRDLWSWSATAEAERTVSTQQHAFARAIERAHGIGGSHD